MAFSVQSDPYIIMSSSFSESSRVCLMNMVRNGYKIAFLSDYSFKKIIRYIYIYGTVTQRAASALTSDHIQELCCCFFF